MSLHINLVAWWCKNSILLLFLDLFVFLQIQLAVVKVMSLLVTKDLKIQFKTGSSLSWLFLPCIR